MSVSCRYEVTSNSWHVRCAPCRYDNYYKPEGHPDAKADAAEHRRWHKANPNF